MDPARHMIVVSTEARFLWEGGAAVVGQPVLLAAHHSSVGGASEVA